MKTVCSKLVNHPMFKGMSLEHLEILSDGAMEQDFQSGELLFKEGEPASNLYIIEEGTIELESCPCLGMPAAIQTLHAGDVLGWSWLFPPFAWNFRARAIEPGRLLVLNGAHLLVASEEDEVFGYELMKRLCQVAIERLQATRKKLLELRGRTNLLAATPVLADPSDWSHPVRDSMEAVALDHPFFEGLSSEHLKLLGSYGMQVQFKKGESIFREGDVANRFYLIEEGKVALESHLKDGPTVGVQTIGKGDVLGWSWLFPPYYWNFDARAVEPTKAIFLYGTRLREECESNPVLGLQLLKRMAKVIIHRLQATRGQLNELNLTRGGAGLISG